MNFFGRLPLAILLQTCALTLAAPPGIPVNFTSELSSPAILTVSNATTINTRRLPPDPYQVHVIGTKTSIIFSKYGQKLLPKTVLDLCFEAQNQIVDALVANHGDGPMPWRLSPSWWSANTQVKISAGKVMSWSMLAHTFKGIVQFMDTYGYMALKFDVLDDDSGIVGRGSIIYTRTP